MKRAGLGAKVRFIIYWNRASNRAGKDTVGGGSYKHDEKYNIFFLGGGSAELGGEVQE